MSVTLRRRALLVLVVSLSILYSCSRETTKSVSGKVVKIADGDTITILDAQNVQHKIRLQGIDAPERRQDFGAISQEHLGGLVFGKHVRIDYEKVDWRGRLIGKVWFGGKDECLEQLKAGLAWHYKEYEKEQSPTDRRLYATAEQEARAQKLGLWRDSTPIPPWDYRHHKSGSSAESDSQDELASDEHNLKSTSSSVEHKFFTHPPPAAQERPSQRAPFVNSDVAGSGLIRGNKRSMIYHWPGCPNYDDISLPNRALFQSREEAAKAGYRAARNCH